MHLQGRGLVVVGGRPKGRIPPTAEAAPVARRIRLSPAARVAPATGPVGTGALVVAAAVFVVVAAAGATPVVAVAKGAVVALVVAAAVRSMQGPTQTTLRE